MPIEWLLAGQAALNAGAGLAAKGVLGKAAKAGADLFHRGGPIDKDLSGALAQAGEGFEASLRALYPDDHDLSALVQQLAQRDDFHKVLGSLPYLPFSSIDVTDVREVFVERRGTVDAGDDFDGAWRAASKRFAQAAAKKDEVKRFVDLQLQARREQREEIQLATIEEIRATLQKSEERQARLETPAYDDPSLASYRRAVYEEFRYADTSGLFQREKVAVGEAIGLEEIFVETPLGREAELRLAPNEGTRESNEAGTKAKRKPEESRDLTEIRPIREALLRDRLIVILGPPGAGKSTLMRCLALSVCRPLDSPRPILETGLDSSVIPVLLPLKEYASALRNNASLELEPFLLSRFSSKLPRLGALLESGRTLILLDGFDEVFDERQRLWVRDQVWRLSSHHSAARFVLTSRPHGYASAPLPGPVATWRMLSFKEDDIRGFLHGWFLALAQQGGETVSTIKPNREAELLAQEILSRQRLKEMAVNPLLCTLIVLVHRNRSGRLPDRRVVFFEAAAKTFAESWERAKHAPVQAGENRYEFPDPEILLRALAEVAWRASHELGSREIPGDKLRAWLWAYLEGEPDWSGARGRRAVSDFLRLVDQRTGLLVQLGGDTYQIVHLSLHEWFVSYYLLDRLSAEKRIAVLRHYLHVPEWEEDLRLMIAGARQAEAEAMISAILDQPSHELESLLRRDFQFVLLCLEDQAPIGPKLRQRVVNEAVRALQDQRVIDRAGLLAALSPLRGAPEIREYFLQGLHEDFILRSSAVSFFAKMSDMSDPDATVRHLFLRWLEEGDPEARSAAMSFFAQNGASDETVRQAVLRRLGDDDLSIRSSAISFLAQIGASDATVQQAVLRGLGDVSPSVRHSVIYYFTQIGAPNDIVRQAILSRLDDDDPSVRDSSVFYLAKIGANDSTVGQAFLRRLDDDDPRARCSAISFFTRINASHETLLQEILRRLDDDDPRVRSYAVKFFSQIGAFDGDIRQAVLLRLSDEDPDVRESAVLFFDKSSAPADDRRNAFILWLDDGNPCSRESAFSFFSRIGASDSAVRREVLQRLYDEDEHVQARAFEFAFFGEFLPVEMGDPIDLFLELDLRGLTQYTSREFRDQLSREIGRRAAGNVELRSRLIEEGPKTRNLRFAAAIKGLAFEEDRLRRGANPLPF